jgi:hypothetical protein
VLPLQSFSLFHIYILFSVFSLEIAMSITITPANIDHVPQMCDCGRRAFENDGLQNALFPAGFADPDEPDAAHEAHLERMRKRIQMPGSRYVVAMQESVDGELRVLGFAAFFTPVDQGDTAEPEEPEVLPSAQEFPKSMDVDVYKYATEVMEEAKKEILGENVKKIWCMLHDILILVKCT